MYTQSIYLPINDNWTGFYLAGVTTGYEDTGAICLLELGPLCSVIGGGFQYESGTFKPRISLFGLAFVLSISYTF